ncbi:MAG: 3-isopropylmalate dehydrogenase [Acidobacteriota bacterium]
MKKDAAPSPSALIAVLAGDGIGPEVTEQAVRVLRRVAELGGHDFELRQAAVGGQAIDSFGEPLPVETLELCDEAEAILLGAVGGPKWSDPTLKARPEQGLLRLRKEFGLFANLRPIKAHPALVAASPLKAELLAGVDLMMVRELTGGLYFGARKREADTAVDTCVYTEGEVARTVRVACELARHRRRRLTSIDKANVLETSRLWRETTERLVAEEYPDIELEHRYVDAAAMQLLRQPGDFDVIVTGNLFGDILSDEASVIAGSLGMLPSASLGEGRKGLYEPVHGSAPDIAGQGTANPYAAILCVALLLRHSLGLEQEAAAVEDAVGKALAGGVLTADLVAAGQRPVSTEEAGAAVLEVLEGY